MIGKVKIKKLNMFQSKQTLQFKLITQKASIRVTNQKEGILRIKIWRYAKFPY